MGDRGEQLLLRCQADNAERRDSRHLWQVLLDCFNATVAFEKNIVLVHRDRIAEAKLADGRRNVVDLFVVVVLEVICQRNRRFDRKIDCG